jgi:hypothetical protein
MVRAGFGPAEWIKGTLTIPNQVYMKKLIVSIKTHNCPAFGRIILPFSVKLYRSFTLELGGFTLEITRGIFLLP